jgi:hypothetical protein
MPECCPVLRTNIEHVKILTDEARRVIANTLRHGVYGVQPEACEPPYMAPSEDPDDYSAVCNLPTQHASLSDYPLTQWCSLCKDFGALLLLCATCRVGICVRTQGTTGGCLKWDRRMMSPDLIFYCMFCTRKHGFDFEVRGMWQPVCRSNPRPTVQTAHQALPKEDRRLVPV